MAKLSASPAKIERSPTLGEHTDEILGESVGCSAERIATLRTGGKRLDRPGAFVEPVERPPIDPEDDPFAPGHEERTPPDGGSYPTVTRHQTTNGGMLFAKSAPNLMQRLPGLPTTPHVEFLLRRKPKPSPLFHKHHL